MTDLETATLAGHAALLAVDGRSFTAASLTAKALVEEGEATPGERFTKGIEEADDVILHFAKQGTLATGLCLPAGWTVEEGLILTGADGKKYRVARVFPDPSLPTLRLRCRVT